MSRFTAADQCSSQHVDAADGQATMQPATQLEQDAHDHIGDIHELELAFAQQGTVHVWSVYW